MSHFDRVCDTVARLLPEGMEIVIELERGCGSVKLTDANGVEHEMETSYGMEDAVDEAMKLAKELSDGDR